MPKTGTRKPRTKKAAAAAGPLPESSADGAARASSAAPVATAVEEAPPTELQPPTTPVEASVPEKTEKRSGSEKDRIVASLNIAKLQAMSMNDLKSAMPTFYRTSALVYRKREEGQWVINAS